MTFEYYGCRHAPKVLSEPRKRLVTIQHESLPWVLNVSVAPDTTFLSTSGQKWRIEKSLELLLDP